MATNDTINEGVDIAQARSARTGKPIAGAVVPTLTVVCAVDGSTFTPMELHYMMQGNPKHLTKGEEKMLYGAGWRLINGLWHCPNCEPRP